MRGLTKALMAAIAALIIGFGAGEVFGPQALEAGDPGDCPYMQCWVITCPPWEEPCPSSECRADEEPFFCEELDWDGENQMCVQEHCYEPE